MLGLIGMTKIPGLGPQTCKNLIAYCGGIQKVFNASRDQLTAVPGIGEKISRALLSRKILSGAEKEMRFAERRGVAIVSYWDRAYPRTLRTVKGAPLVLYKKGDIALNDIPSIAIVGTRKASAYGRKIARIFARAFADSGVNVVSGLAYGIDEAAHSSVIHEDGLTTAVLGHGIDRIYPQSHRGKAEKILEKGGGIITEFTSGTKPEAYNFPARNRIISGMSHAVLVVEAREKGGALITADFAKSQGRQVYAVPGCIDQRNSVGCHTLIRNGVAKMVTHPDDILKDLGLLNESEKAGNRAMSSKEIGKINPLHLEVLNILGDDVLTIDELSNKCRKAAGELSSVILEMEFGLLLQVLPGNRYRKASPGINMSL